MNRTPVHCSVTRACDRLARRGAAEPARARCCTAETPGPPLRGPRGRNRDVGPGTPADSPRRAAFTGRFGLHAGPEPRGSALLRDERSGPPGGGGSKHNPNIYSDSEARPWRPTLDGLAPAGLRLLVVVAADSLIWGRLSRTHDIRIRADRREFHTPPIACPRTRMCWASPSLAHSSSESYGGGGTCLSLEDLRLRAPACHSYVALSGCGCSGYTYATFQSSE